VDAPEPKVELKNGRPVRASGSDVDPLLEALKAELAQITDEAVMVLTASHAIVVSLTDEQVEHVRAWPTVAKVVESQPLS
jgi:hypothetical protein